jgi:hypothetical protein
LTRIKIVQPIAVDISTLMPAVYGLPLVGVLLIVLILVRRAARKDKRRRRDHARQRERERFYWERASDRSERSPMREDAHQTTVMDSIKSSRRDKGSR